MSVPLPDRMPDSYRPRVGIRQKLFLLLLAACAILGLMELAFHLNKKQNAATAEFDQWCTSHGGRPVHTGPFRNDDCLFPPRRP